MDIKNFLTIKYKKIVKKVKKVKKRTLMCLVIGFAFSVMSFFMNKKSIFIRPYEISRTDYGTGKKAYKLKAEVQNIKDDVELQISVSPKKYTKKEAEKIFRNKLENIKETMLGDNEDFQHITNNLNFLTEVGDGIRANYTFNPFLDDENWSDYIEVTNDNSIATNSSISQFEYSVKYQNLVDGHGHVNNQEFLKKEFCTGNIEIQLSTEIKEKEGIYKSEKYVLPIRIIAKKLNLIENFKNEFIKKVQQNDEKTSNEDTIHLPREIDNQKIYFKENRDFSFLIMFLIGILVAVLLEAKDKEKIKEKEKERIRLLELDFSQIVSKILLYVNSGMTIRNSFIRIADQYIKANNSSSHMAYEEMIVVRNKLESGYSEIKAYEEMANRISLRTYTRFLNIIIQSIKNGNKELKNILNMEVQDALYERKQKARKMGEEASTKLVLPLMMMLSIIMIVIMVPAFMGM